MIYSAVCARKFKDFFLTNYIITNCKNTLRILFLSKEILQHCRIVPYKVSDYRTNREKLKKN